MVSLQIIPFVQSVESDFLVIERACKPIQTFVSGSSFSAFSIRNTGKPGLFGLERDTAERGSTKSSVFARSPACTECANDRRIPESRTGTAIRIAFSSTKQTTAQGHTMVEVHQNNMLEQEMLAPNSNERSCPSNFLQEKCSSCRRKRPDLPSTDHRQVA